jgi:hypothetical protein
LAHLARSLTLAKLKVDKPSTIAMGRTPRSLRNRPLTPRANGATTGLRTPSPNRTGRSASRESTTTLPTRDEQVNHEAPCEDIFTMHVKA